MTVAIVVYKGLIPVVGRILTNMKFSCLDIIVLRNITNFVHCGCGDNGFAASFTISIFNVLIATFLFFNGVKIELC